MAKKKTKRHNRIILSHGLVCELIETAAEREGSQSALAKKVGVSQQQISKYINGVQSPCDAMLKYLKLRRVTCYEVI